MRRGDLRWVTGGDFRGDLWRIRDVHTLDEHRVDKIVVQRQNEEGDWRDFGSGTRAEIEQLSKPVLHCPVDFGHHLGDCCLTCGNDERKAGAHLPNNPDLTAEDKARFRRKDELFEENWGHHSWRTG